MTNHSQFSASTSQLDALNYMCNNVCMNKFIVGNFALIDDGGSLICLEIVEEKLDTIVVTSGFMNNFEVDKDEVIDVYTSGTAISLGYL